MTAPALLQPLRSDPVRGLRLYSERASGIWDPVLTGHGWQPAVFATQRRASAFAAALCAEFKLRMEVRDETGFALERWTWSARQRCAVRSEADGREDPR